MWEPDPSLSLSLFLGVFCLLYLFQPASSQLLEPLDLIPETSAQVARGFGHAVNQPPSTHEPLNKEQRIRTRSEDANT